MFGSTQKSPTGIVGGVLQEMMAACVFPGLLIDMESKLAVCDVLSSLKMDYHPA